MLKAIIGKQFTASVFIVVMIILAGCSNPRQRERRIEHSGNSGQAETDLDSLGTEVEFDDFDSMVRKFEDPERKNWQSPELVINKMGNLSGKVVADIGVGTGYFAFRLIGQGATVIGIDIDDRFLEYINERKSELSPEVAGRLITRISDPDNPALNQNEVDWILIVNTYHYLKNRIIYLEKLFKTIKPGGRIMIVDYNRGNSPVGPAENEKVYSQVTVSELKSAGFRVIDVDEESLQYQYIIRATRP
jgi:SAM-dependent methyltransferase